MPLLERYLGGVILRYTVLALLALLGLFVFVDFLEQLGDLGKGGYGLGDALAYTALTIPRNLYELLPLAALLGALTGLSLLAADSELIVLRAGGVSVARIAAVALKVGALLAIAAVVIGEWVAPPSEIRAQRGRAEALQQNIKQQTDFGLWFRDGGDYVNIGEVLPDLTVRRVKRFQFDADNQLRELSFAAHGRYQNDRWALSDVAQTRFTAGGDATTARFDMARWSTAVTPQILSVFLLQPDQLPLMKLRRYIGHLDDNQQQTAAYRLAFWNKLMLPLSAAVMLALAVPFAFVNIRARALGRSLFTGVILGLSFHATTRALGYITLAHGIPPFLGALLPLLVFGLLAAVMIRRVG